MLKTYLLFWLRRRIVFFEEGVGFLSWVFFGFFAFIYMQLTFSEGNGN